MSTCVCMSVNIPSYKPFHGQVYPSKYSTFWHQFLYLLAFLLLWKQSSKTTRGRNGLFGLLFYVIIHHRGKPQEEFKLELEAGSEAETMEEVCFLTCYPWLALLASIHDPEPHGQGWHSSQWAGAFLQQSLIKKMPGKCVHKQIQWRRFFIWSSLFPSEYSVSPDKH